MLRVILARAGLFIVFASAIWALLPLIAQSTLHLGAGGYGLLLGSVGIGAVAGAALLPRLRARLSPDTLLAAGSIGMAAVTLSLAYAHVTAVAAVALVLGGACWILALSTLNSLYQLSLPGWIKARGMSFYLMVFQGGGAVGSAIMGLIAERAGLSVTLTIAAAGLALGPLAGLVWRFRSIPPESLLPAGDLPAPVLAPDQTPDGPVLVGIQYRARPGLEDQLMTALQQIEEQPTAYRRDLLAGLARRQRPRPGARGVRRRFLGRAPPPARARDQARTGASGARPRADRPGPPCHRHPLAGRQLAQATRISGQAEVTYPGGRRTWHDKLVELGLFAANGIRQRCAKWSGCQFPRQYRFADATRASFSFATAAT